MARDMITGASYLLRGYRLLMVPGIRRYVLFPFLVNLVVFALLLWLGIDRFGVLMDWLLPPGDGWWIAAARTVLWLVFTLTAVLILLFAFTLAANLIGAPFNGLLSERVESYLAGVRVPEKSEGPGTGLSGVIAALGNELRKFLSFLFLSALVLLLSVIPVLNLAFPLVWTLFAAWLLSLEYLGYPMENHGIRLGFTRNHLPGKRFVMLGFGLAVLGASAVPFLNLLIMPAAVAGATALWTSHRPDAASRGSESGTMVQE